MGRGSKPVALFQTRRLVGELTSWILEGTETLSAQKGYELLNGQSRLSEYALYGAPYRDRRAVVPLRGAWDRCGARGGSGCPRFGRLKSPRVLARG